MWPDMKQYRLYEIMYMRFKNKHDCSIGKELRIMVTLGGNGGVLIGNGVGGKLQGC